MVQRSGLETPRETQEGELEVVEVKMLSRMDQIKNEDMRGTEHV